MKHFWNVVCCYLCNASCKQDNKPQETLKRNKSDFPGGAIPCSCSKLLLDDASAFKAVFTDLLATGGSRTSCKHNIEIVSPWKDDMANSCLFTLPADTEQH